MKMHQSSVKEIPNSGNDTKKEKEYEDIISYIIGDFGRWQLQLTFLLSLFNIPCTWHIYAPVFLSLPRDYWCSRPSNLADLTPQQWRNVSQPIDQCSIYNVDWANYSRSDVLSGKVNTSTAALVKCTSWEWDGSGEESIVSQWNLVCDRKDLVNVAEMMFLIGVAFGGLVGGIISDHYGRKRTLMASLVLQIIIGTAIAFTPWLSLYLFLRMSLGFFSVSVVFSGFVLALEIVGGKWRAITGISYLFPVSIGYISISGIAYLLRDWRDLQLAISLPGILMLGLYWVLPESPRWYLALGEKQKVINIIQTAVVVNKRKMPENIDKLVIVPSSTTPANETKQSAGVMDLFRTKQMRKNTLLLFVIWFAVYLVYYGLVLNMTELGGNVYINTILSGLVEVPALAASILFLRGGRRWPFCLTLAFAGIACLVAVFVSGDEIHWLTTSFAMIGKLCISSSNAVMPVFTAELYPTVIRNLGVGASNVAAGIALILVPYLWLLSEMSSGVPMIVLGVCGIIGGLCVLPLPETGNMPLAGTIEDQQHQQEAYQHNHQHHNNRQNHYGSNSIETNLSASTNNLPEEKLQVETFTVQTAPISLTDTRL